MMNRDYFVSPSKASELAKSFGFSIHHSPKFGNCVYTNVGIKAGELFYAMETACAVVPGTGVLNICGKCYTTLPPSAVPCVNCEQKYCSVACRDQDRIHCLICTGLSAEGAHFHEALQQMQEEMDCEFGNLRLAIRIWLLTFAYFPNATAAPLDFMQPVSFHEFFSSRPEEQESIHALTNVYDALLASCFRTSAPPEWATFAAFLRLFSVTICNAFAIALGNFRGDGVPTGSAIFPFHCQIAHSCRPNCTWSSCIMPNCPPSIALTPCRDIAAGEMITLPYFTADDLPGVLGRRAETCTNRRFLCCCEWCEEEAEALRPLLLARKGFEFPLNVLEMECSSLAVGIQVVLLTLNKPVPETEVLLQLKHDALARKLVALLIEHICCTAPTAATTAAAAPGA